MNNLNSTLARYASRFTNLLLEAGETASPEKLTKKEQDLEAAKADFMDRMGAIIKNNKTFFWMTVIMLLVIFVATIAGIIYYIGNLNTVKTISTISGLSLAGMIYYMNSLWRQIVGIEMAIAMADRFDAKAMLSIINSLIVTQKTGKRTR